jgi:L-ascorbate metabolism protein UlaG (beta-lactamase superfamily)
MSTLTITRIAHSSVLIDFDGHRVLTDPWFSERFGYYHGEPYGITLEALPRLSGVVVSHDHYDHYDMNAFRPILTSTCPSRSNGASNKRRGVWALPM